MMPEPRPLSSTDDINPFLAAESHTHFATDSDESILLNLPLTVPASIPATRSLLDLPGTRVDIVEAGASSEGSGSLLKKYVVYTIRLFADTLPGKDTLTRRRYSDFVSLHDLLVRIFPLVIVPPIPPKHYNSLLFGGLKSSTTSATHSMPGHSSPPYVVSDAKLIEHRKRLLSSFLMTCLQIPKIRSLDLFADFLSPYSSWLDEVRLAQRRLPRSIYLLNPDNALRTDSVYSHLPQPVSSHAMAFINKRMISRTTTRLLSGVPESRPRPPSPDLELKTSSIDEINSKILHTLSGLSTDYCELGSIFNAFSLVLLDNDSPRLANLNAPESSTNTALILKTMSHVFDRTYVTLNSLIGDFEVDFCEPLGVAVQEAESFQAMSKFYGKKRRQKELVQQEASEKKRELAILERVESEHPQAPAQQKDTVQPARSKFLTLRSIKRFSRYVTDIMVDLNPPESRTQKIATLETKVAALEECSKVVLEDIAYIADEIHKSAQYFEKKQLRLINEVLRRYYAHLISWAKQNIDLWEEVKEQINGM